MAQPRKLPPFSMRKSWRETVAFAGGLVAVVGAFGPWFRATLVQDGPMSAPVTTEEVLLAAPQTAWIVALALACGLALGLSPLPRLTRLVARVSLFGLAVAALVASLVLGPSGFPFTWGGVFHEYEDVRPAWGFVLCAVGAIVGAIALLSRAREAAAAESATPGA